MANPIWKDYYVDFGEVDYVDYTIRVLVSSGSSTTVYSGRAYRKPDANTVRVRINDICANYFAERTFPMSGEMGVKDIVQNFAIYSGTSLIDSVDFVWDWSYRETEKSVILSEPINGRIGLNMRLVWSSATGGAIKYASEGGSSLSATVDKSSDNDIRMTSLGVFDIFTEDLTEKVEYEVVQACCKYALYYVNAFGGWDVMLMEGNYSETDSLTRHIKKTEYNNNELVNRGKHNYVNEISKSLTLHTSWLSDEESSRMHHLLESTSVYLYDLTEDTYTPVIIKEDTVEYKKYKSNGGKLVNYAVNVEIAHDRVRR